MAFGGAGISTLLGWLEAVARARWNDEALVAADSAWSYGELWTRSGRIAAAIERRLPARGEKFVGLVGQNTPELVAAYIGIIRAGAVVVPLNPRDRPPEMRSQLDFVGAANCVLADAAGELSEELRSTGPIWESSSLDESPADGSSPSPSSVDPAVCILTSGSTGAPKGVIHTQGTMLHAALQLASALPFSRSDVSLAFLPVYASAAEQIFPALLRGGSLRLIKKFDVDEICAAAKSATSFTAVPTIIARLLRDGDVEELRHLRWIGFASEPMPRSVLELWWQEVPTARTYQYYGMSEMLPITVAGPEALAGAPSSVGAPFPTSRVEILDEGGNALKTGEEGEIACLSPACMKEYLHDEAATCEALTREGAMKTGDRGRFDDSGRLFLTGRIKDLIISGGLNISAVEIESVACRYPGVSSVAVVGIPHEKWGETPVVIAAPAKNKNLSGSELLAHCRLELAGYKRPSAVAVVDEIPTIGIGKLAKLELRERLVNGSLPLVFAEGTTATRINGEEFALTDDNTR